MHSALIAAVVFACLVTALLLGMWLRRLLPAHHLSAETKDTVRLAMGLVATMTALLLGLLVSSAKGSYDTLRGDVIQMAAKISFLDRMLTGYGPETAEARAQLRTAVEGAVRRLWPEDGAAPALGAANLQAGNAVYAAIQHLAPRDDAQRIVKTQAANLAVELGELRELLLAQSVSSVSKPLLVFVALWLVVIFLSFSLLAPRNATATLALVISALSVSGAIFLILELDRPFGGLVRISSEPMLQALNHLTR